MRYGFYLPIRGPTAAPDALATLVAKAEGFGFSSVMIADHIVFPTVIESKYPYTVGGAFPGQGDALEQLTLMSFVAAKTERLRLVSSVMILPYRNPVLTAKVLATIDVLSGGRVTVGVGVGWLEEEFEAVGAPPFARRGAVSDEWLRIFKKLWTEDPVEHAGEFYSFGPLHCQPQPVQRPHPPIWVGGHSKPALRRAARYGDGWHPVGATAAVPLPPAELRAKLAELRRLTEAEGRDFDRLSISYKAPLYDRPGDAPSDAAAGDRKRFAGSPEEIAGDIRELEALGVSEMVFDFRSPTLSESLERMERFATGVMKLA